jgi:hypothetical protein
MASVTQGPIPVQLIPPEWLEILDPFGEEFAGFPDEAPELPYGSEFDPFDEPDWEWPAGEAEAIDRMENGWLA